MAASWTMCLAVVRKGLRLLNFWMSFSEKPNMIKRRRDIEIQPVIKIN